MKSPDKYGSRSRACSMSVFAAAFFALLLSAVPAFAGVLTVGPDQFYKAPSQVARMVQPGDTVKIAPGTYHDCTVWKPTT